MMFIAIVVILGLVKKQGRKYWLHALSAVALQNALAYLFAGGGTLENSEGDGVLTAMIRTSTNDGPEMAAVGILVIVVAWVVPIWLVRRGYSASKKEQEPNDDAV